jgi:hypothetical protein
MFGPSYLGFVQWAVAAPGAGAETPPPDALSIQVSASQFFDQTYPGGSLSLETLASWMVIIAVQEARVPLVAINRALRGLRSAVAQLPLSDLDERTTGDEVDWFREAFADTDRSGSYWAARDHSDTVGDVTAPVSFVGGWHDILLPWMVADFEALQAAGRRPRLTIGPWTHTAPGLVGAGHRDGIAWMRAHLLGDDRLVTGAPVRVRVTGERSGGGWRELDRWPPPGTIERRLWPVAGGELAEATPEMAGAGGDRYTYDPADPTPSLGGPVLLERAAVVDNGPLEARDDVLVYSGPPLPATMEAIGDVEVELFARASADWFDLFARVCDVDAAGVSRNVTDGLVSVAPDRFERDDDGVWRVPVRLWPIGHRFAAGHRIRLLVASGAHPRYGRNPGTGQTPQLADPETMRSVDVEILRDADHPSVLVLPASG